MGAQASPLSDNGALRLSTCQEEIGSVPFIKSRAASWLQVLARNTEQIHSIRQDTRRFTTTKMGYTNQMNSQSNHTEAVEEVLQPITMRSSLPIDVRSHLATLGRKSIDIPKEKDQDEHPNTRYKKDKDDNLVVIR